MTAAELVRYDSGPALVAYLGQPDASPTVCDLRARGPHISALTADMRGALIDGLVDGKIDAVLWRRCIEVALKGLAADQVPSVFDDVMLVYRKLLKDSDLQTDPALAERVATIQRLYVDRRPGLDGHAKVLVPIFDDLRASLAKNDLPAVARTFAAEVIATFDIEHGTWQGRRVDLPMMDALAATGNEMTLTRFAKRLPEPDLREQAKRRIVRVHVALSAFDEVRTAAAAVEEAVRAATARPGDAKASLALAAARRRVAQAVYYEEAREFARIVSSTCQLQGRREYVIVTGGGPGVMEGANRGAHDVGAISIGLNITLPFEQLPNPYITPDLCFQFRYFAIRKMHFLMRARALVAFPGGYGTFDELFETLTLVQTKKVAPLPIVLLGREFWEKAISWDFLAAEGMVTRDDTRLFRYADTARDAWDLITRFHGAGGWPASE